MRSYYCRPICTSCVSFVNAFRHCRVIIGHFVRSCAFLLSHAMRLRLPQAPTLYCTVEPLIGLPFASCPGWETIKAAAVLLAAVVGWLQPNTKQMTILYAAAHKFTMAVPTWSPEVNLKCDFN